MDAAGQLRCFFATSSNQNVTCSYVYELGDIEYVRTEALQRATRLFATQLDEVAPSSVFSATRFSSSDMTTNQLNKLVLLDWTNDSALVARMMALTYGDGSTTGFAIGEKGNAQYNYGLTGATSTWRGLQAYVSQLDRVDEHADAPKYLILFTDGQDTGRNETNKDANGKDYADSDKRKYAVTVQYYEQEGTENEKVLKTVDTTYSEAANKLAQHLKEQGYIIFTV